MEQQILDILRFPQKKGNHFKPWYQILWGFCLLLFVIVFGIAFYVSYFLFTFDLYTVEQFRKDYF